MFINIAFWLGSDRPSSLFLRARFTSFRNHSFFLIIFFCLFVLFRFCYSHAWVFGKTLMYEFLISHFQTEWYFLLADSAAISAQYVFGAKK